MGHGFAWAYKILYVSIPSRGFWFFEGMLLAGLTQPGPDTVSIPSRGFWFFEVTIYVLQKNCSTYVSIPSRGFWFFEDISLALLAS